MMKPILFTLTLVVFIGIHPFSNASEICLNKILNVTDFTVYTIIVPHPVMPSTLILGTKKGVLHIAQSDPVSGAVTAQEKFLDISASISTQGNEGLLGFTFHPDFASNGRFFVSATCSTSSPPPFSCSHTGTLAIDEYVTANPATALNVPSTPTRRILSVPEVLSSHIGGQILFSPDNFMMIMLGDGSADDLGGFPGNAQDGRSLLGKILRIDVDSVSSKSNYVVPFSNPFVGVEDILDEIFVLGLNNPWRCSFDTNDMLLRKPNAPIYCGVTGEHTTESIFRFVAGDNAGWNKFEGSEVFNNDTKLAGGRYVKPVYEYRHVDGRAAAVIGGYFFRPNHFSAGVTAEYLFADMFNQLKVTTQTGSFSHVRNLSWRCGFASPERCDKLGFVYTFGEDNSGNLFISASGGIFRVVSDDQCGFFDDQ